MRAALWALLRRLFFRLDAESIHRFSVSMVRLVHRFGGHRTLRLLSGTPVLIGSSSSAASGAHAPFPAVFGMEFASRLGLAAGFDKDAELVEALPSLGFGFAEIGTVTPRPQGGNERPRLFRDSADRAIFNRMGFNGLGAAVVSERLDRARARLPARFRIGVNVGKNKDTPLEDAARDYVRATLPFEGLADYLVLNVSSPNTPGLRSLQAVESLKPIVGGVAEVIARWDKRPPLLLKLAPELTGEDLGAILQEGPRWGIDGWILTNTLAGTWHFRQTALQGGYSGAPLTVMARRTLIEARKLTHLPIISVGGIMDENEALRRRQEGAELLQIYAGWIFGGPSFPSRIARRLLDS